MKNAKFKTGDIVRLKSGGPDMTIEKVFDLDIIENDSDADGTIIHFIYLCRWFMKTKLEEERFGEITLEYAARKTGLVEDAIVIDQS